MIRADKRLTVVLAEDDENDIILIRRAFSRLLIPASLIAVPNGEHIFPYLRGDDPYRDRTRYPYPDVLLLDRRMPRLSGLDVLFWLRTEPQFERLAVVIVSNGFLPQESETVRGLNAACALKSSEFRDMPRTLEEAIRLARALVLGSEAAGQLPKTSLP